MVASHHQMLPYWSSSEGGLISAQRSLGHIPKPCGHQVVPNSQASPWLGGIQSSEWSQLVGGQLKIQSTRTLDVSQFCGPQPQSW